MRDESAEGADNNLHAEFIDNLGGPTAVANWINARLDEKNSPRKRLSSQSVNMWKNPNRRIPFHWRGMLVMMANEKSISAPPNFFETD